jgi:hypothetical protein
MPNIWSDTLPHDNDGPVSLKSKRRLKEIGMDYDGLLDRLNAAAQLAHNAGDFRLETDILFRILELQWPTTR